MSHCLIEQLRLVRQCMVNDVNRRDEHNMPAVPTGLNNSIKWNPGHMYMSAEKIIFQLTGEQASIPEGFMAYFGMGASPASWSDERNACIMPQSKAFINNYNSNELDPSHNNEQSRLKFRDHF